MSVPTPNSFTVNVTGSLLALPASLDLSLQPASTVPASIMPTPKTTAGRLIIATRMETPRFSHVVRCQGPLRLSHRVSTGRPWTGTLGCAGCLGRPWSRTLRRHDVGLGYGAAPGRGRQDTTRSALIRFRLGIGLAFVRALSQSAVEPGTGYSPCQEGTGNTLVARVGNALQSSRRARDQDRHGRRGQVACRMDSSRRDDGPALISRRKR